MKKFTMAIGEELTPLRIGEFMKAFQTDCLPILTRRYNYYIGRHQILNKYVDDITRPCNKIVCNFVKSIVETYEGYAVGIPVTYSSENSDMERLEDILKYNDVRDADAELFRKGLIFGRAGELAYFDADGKMRFRPLSSLECAPIYDNTLDEELLYGVRFWKERNIGESEDHYIIEVYDSNSVRRYNSSMNFSSVNFVEEKVHNFDQVPMHFFSLNDEEEGIADSIFSLQDAYNALISDSIDDWDAFCDAYLILTGITADNDDLEAMKKYRTLMLDEGSSASYLTKATNTTEIEHLLSTVETKIREMSACPNFASENFGTSSGIAIRYRCMALENNTQAILSNFKKALQKRIEILSVSGRLLDGEELWRDIDITFHRNLPINETEIAQEVNQFRGLVSDRTLLGQIPFITDVDKELDLIAEQKSENIETYGSFMMQNNNEEEDDELLEQ